MSVIMNNNESASSNKEEESEGSSSSSSRFVSNSSKIRNLFMVLVSVTLIVVQNLRVPVSSSSSTSSSSSSSSDSSIVTPVRIIDENNNNAIKSKRKWYERKKQPRPQQHQKTKRKKIPATQLHRERLERIQQQRLFAKQQKNWQNLPENPYIEPPPEEPLASSTPSSKPLKVGYPIFVLNLPKSGTTTIWQYFECGLGPNHAVHWWTNSTITNKKAIPTPARGKKPPPANEAAANSKRIGPCVEHNILLQEEDILPLHRCGQFDVWIDFGYATPKGQCWFPAVHGYKQLYESYPNATFLMIPRKTEAWYKSASNWGNGNMLRKWKNSCGSTFFPATINNTQNNIKRNRFGSLSMIRNEDFKEFYTRTLENLRQFAKEHSNFNYIEPPPTITLESPDLATWLEETIGIDASCWPGKCQPNGRKAKCVPSSKQQKSSQPAAEQEKD